MQTTVGPLAPEVYWRRRLAMLGVLVVALVTLRACATGDTSRAGGTSAAAGPTPSATPDGTVAHPFSPVLATPGPLLPDPFPSPTLGGNPSPSPNAAAPATGISASPAAPVIGMCADSHLVLTAASDARTYAVGAKPRLSMTVRNVGPSACLRDLGAGARELVVTSGTAHTWASGDCTPSTTSTVVLLPPKVTQTFPVVWSGQRSLPKCAGSRQLATAGTYRLQVRLGSLRSDSVVFHLT